MQSLVVKEPTPEHTPCPKIVGFARHAYASNARSLLANPAARGGFPFCVLGYDNSCNCCTPVILTAFCVALCAVAEMKRYRIRKVCNRSTVLRTIMDWAISELEFVPYFGYQHDDRLVAGPWG